jgi:EAL domain-containing protein (putative c-di-GMP-specific phosphodiesterase class I)
LQTIADAADENDTLGRVDTVQRCLDRAVDGVGLASVFQPIVSLADDTAVGFEALTRWPQLCNPSPADVFVHASATGRVSPLNQLCVDSAISAALQAGLPRNTLLMINTEPGGQYRNPSDHEILARAQTEFRLAYEVTERNLLDHPRALLEMLTALRADGIAIALDDVGAHPNSLALLDVVGPDIVKLDRALVQPRLDEKQLRTVNAVRAHHERTGAVILAEGIETDEQRKRALDLGAVLAQGFKFGHPGPLADFGRPAATFNPGRSRQYRTAAISPFRIAASAAPVRREVGTKMLSMSVKLESCAQKTKDAQFVLAAFGGGRHFTGSTYQRYESLATSASLVGVFGKGLPAKLGSGVRRIELDSTDPLCAEWVALTLGPGTATAIVGRESAEPDHGSACETTFDVAITNSRPVVAMIAHNLLSRIG